MSSVREMREHIRTIDNIEQMTRALQAVSASRVRNATKLSTESAPYSSMAWDVLVDLYEQNSTNDEIAPIFQDHEKLNSALVVFISADRGLAGSFPANIFRHVTKLENSLPGVQMQYITIGKKGRDMLLRRKKKVIADFSDMGTLDFQLSELAPIWQIIFEEFNGKQADRVYLVYTEYISASSYFPVTRVLLPLADSIHERLVQSGEKKIEDKDCIYEIDPVTLMNGLIPRVIKRVIYHAILSSQASEFTARMVAMSHASENAETLKHKLNLQYNKVRQQTITNDLIDIVGGAEAQTQDADKIMKKIDHISQMED